MRWTKIVALLLILFLITPGIASAKQLNMRGKLMDRYHIDLSTLLNFTALPIFDINHDGYLENKEIGNALLYAFPELSPTWPSIKNYTYFKNFTVDSRPAYILKDTLVEKTLSPLPIKVNSTISIELGFTIEFYFNGSAYHIIHFHRPQWSGRIELQIPSNWSYMSSSLKDLRVKSHTIQGVYSNDFIIKLREDKYFWMDLAVYSSLALIFGLFVFMSYRRRKRGIRLVNILVGSFVRNIIALLLTLSLIFYFLWVLGPALEARVVSFAPVSLRLQLVHLYGLDKPWYVQFFKWWEFVFTGKLLTSLNWDSTFTYGQLVEAMIKSTYIFALATGFSYFVSTFMATYSGKKRKLDPAGLVFIGLYSIPTFVAGLMFLQLSAINYEFYVFLVSPINNMLEYLRLVFPALILGILTVAKPYLLTKNVALREYRAPYVFMFRAVGFEKRKIRKVVRRTSLIPMITDSVLNFGWILTAQVFIEVIFKIKGMGYLLFIGTMKGNPFEVQISLVYLAMVMIAGSILADVLIYFLDPRVRR